jgi:hypothetical protein
MLWLERRVVSALAGADDERTGGGVSEFVETSLQAMPQHLRLGVAVESIGLGLLTRLRYGSQPSPEAIQHSIDAWERAPVGVVRQYPRLLNSLVLFARYELPDA